MAKKHDVDVIKAANGTVLNEDDYSAAELATLRQLAEGGEAKKAEFENKLAEFKKPASQNTNEATAEDSAPTIKVKVSDKGSGSYLHPVSKQAIVRGASGAVSVPDDSWTQDMLAKRFLTEVRK